MKLFLNVELFQRKKIRFAEDIGWKEHCMDMLEDLNQSEDAGPFRQPVTNKDAPDYLLYIYQPMDLRTVREQLIFGHYATPIDFAKDVRLIFENSKIYNTDRRWKIFGQTDRLSELFEKQFKIFSTSYNQNLIKSSKSRNKEDTSKCKVNNQIFTFMK